MISQGISGILCLVYIVKAVPILHLHKEDWRPSGHLLKIQLAVGIPMALQYSITAIGTMMVQTALNLLGSTQVAAFTAANKIEQIVTQAYVAMGTTMATYCAQNIGAGKIKRIRQGFKSITIMGSIYSVVVAAIIMTVGKYMTYLFLSGDLTEIMAFRGYLPEMRRYFLYSAYRCKCLPEWNPGNGIWTAPDDGWCG